MSSDKADQQPKGGDHIPSTNEPQDEEEEQQQPGLLSKIGDPVGMLPLAPSSYHNHTSRHHFHPIHPYLRSSQATSSAPPSAPSAPPSKKASQAPSATPSAAPRVPPWAP